MMEQMERASMAHGARSFTKESIQKRAALWQQIDATQKTAERALGGSNADKRNQISNQINDLSSKLEKLLKRVQ